MAKIIYNLLAVAVIAYMGLVATLFIVQRDRQYYPDKHDASPSETKVPEMQEVQVMVSGEDSREAWIHLPPESDRTVVFFHGNSENIASRDTKVRELIDAGFGVMLVGYRGYGGNRGFPTEDGLYDDARAAVKYLIDERGADQEHLVFYGESLGAAVAVKMATEFPKIAGLVLEVPFDSALAVASDRYWYVIGLSALMLDQYPSDTRIGKLTMPKLILVAQKDDVVAPYHAKRLFKLAAEPKQMIEFPGAKHNNLYDHGAGARITAFISGLNIYTPEMAQ